MLKQQMQKEVSGIFEKQADKNPRSLRSGGPWGLLQLITVSGFLLYSTSANAAKFSSPVLIFTTRSTL